MPNGIIPLANGVHETRASAGAPAAQGERVSIAPELLTSSQAAQLCGIGESTFFRLHAAKKVPAPVKLGGATRWARTELLAWIAAGCPSRELWARLKS
jgi:predicted DNA-binding transcriptional regulator AlpA